MRRKGIARLEPLLYLFPALAFFVLFTYYPFVKTVFNSTFLTNFMGERREFVGLENYLRILQDKEFLAAVKNTFIYVLASVPLSVWWRLSGCLSASFPCSFSFSERILSWRRMCTCILSCSGSAIRHGSRLHRMWRWCRQRILPWPCWL